MRQAQRLISRLGTCVCLIFLGAALAAAQSQFGATGTVLGHIQDSSGGAVPGAKVTLHNQQTGINSVFTTGSAGDYVFVNQIPGNYGVTVGKPGFKTAATAGLIVQVDQTLRQNFTLQVGATTEQVTVSAQAPMLQTDNATIGSVVNSRTIAA
ncbi:MAG: carboxypeptidase-like regulatory domain-containing protein, partial [Terriglobia bacterium]